MSDNQGEGSENVGRLASGMRVQVWVPSTGTWASGFQVVARSATGYVLRRRSDRSVLRHLFAESDVRLEPIPLSPRQWTPQDAA